MSSENTAFREQLNDLDGDVSDAECARFLTAATGVVEGHLRRDLVEDFGASVPDPIKQAILMTAVHLYEYRGLEGGDIMGQGSFFTTMLAPFRKFP